MEETDLLISDGVGIAVKSPSQPRGPEPVLGAMPAVLGDPLRSLPEIAAAAIEWSISVLGFERGFVVFFDRDGGSGVAEPRVVASRALRLEGTTPTWRDVAHPDFAVSRQILDAALERDEVVAAPDRSTPAGRRDPQSGFEPGRGGEQQRAVVARSLSPVPGVRAVLYVDRGLSIEGIDGGDLVRFDAIARACSAPLGRAFLAEEIARLRARIEESEREEEDAEDETEDDGDDAESEAGGADPAAEGGSDEGAREFPSYWGIVGKDPKLLKIFRVIEKIKDSNLNVCVFGESGTGKELIARAIHESSIRSAHRFVSENCGAVSENLLESELFGHVKGAFTGADEDKVGLFEAADGGTLFLDEIGDMSQGMQRKLLRALQEGTIRPIGGRRSISVDVRVICASNRDLKHLVREGSFRSDLFYRLNVIQIHLPPLRERRDDVRLLIDHFTSLANQEEGTRKRFSASALAALCQYSWPGNVRELRNLIRRVLLTCPRRIIARKDVLPFLSSAQAAACLGDNVERDENHLILRIPLRQHFNEIIEECERLVLLNALKDHGWNKSRVTKALKIPRQSLYNKIAKFDLQRT